MNSTASGCAIEALSTGAQEQLAIITRLAISHLVSTGEGSVPVIFDDALGWSDKARLRDMGALLGRAGDHGQVIILTCMPDRYEYVPEGDLHQAGRMTRSGLL